MAFDLAVNRFFRRFTAAVPVSEEAATLPDVAGRGWVRDLREAATLDPGLVPLVRALREAGHRAAYVEAVGELMRRWALTSGYRSASREALAAGYGLILDEPRNEEERGWLDMAVKAPRAEREAFRSGLDPEARARFDAFRERMVGELERLHAYEAFTAFPFLSWSRIRADAFGEPQAAAGPAGQRLTDAQRPFTWLLQRHRIAWPSSEAGYIRVRLPADPQGLGYSQQLWDRLVADAARNLAPATRLAPYTERLRFEVSEAGSLVVDPADMDRALRDRLGQAARDGAALVAELFAVHGRELILLGWDGTAMMEEALSRAAGSEAARQGLRDLGYIVVTNGARIENGRGAWVGGPLRDRLLGASGSDLLHGRGGDDELRGEEGADLLLGGAGNDALYGGPGDDVLDGGPGDDWLSGGPGDDLFRFGPGDGRDRIVNWDPEAGRLDQVALGAGIRPEAVSLERSGRDLVLHLPGEDRLTVQNYFLEDGASPARVDRFVFADGTVWDVETVKAKVLEPTEGPDQITGYATDDVLRGLGGSDWLYGGGGADRLEGGAGGDRLHGETGADTLLGGEGADYLHGGEGADVLDGGPGRDWLSGEDGDDDLQGGVGDDSLYGGPGNDVLEGGPGNDTLDGGPGNDVYRFGPGDGQDRIVNWDGGAGRTDEVVLDAGVRPEEVALERSGRDLMLRLPSGDRLRVQDYFWDDARGPFRVDRFVFADGTAWDVETVKAKVLEPTEGPDRITGYGTDDVLRGLGGSDWLYGGDGADRLEGGAGRDYLLGERGDDLLDGGTDMDWLSGQEGDDRLLGGPGDDTLLGGPGNDVLEGGAGDDWLDGGPGDDVYRFGPGGGWDRIVSYDRSGADELRLDGVVPGEIWFRREGSALEVRLAGGADRLTVDGWYADPERRLARIVAGDGRMLRPADVERLVSAMAAFDPPAAADGIWPESYRRELEPVLAAAWQQQPAAA